MDHRVPFDLNYAINRSTFDQGWKHAYKQKFIGNMIKNYGIQACFASCLISVVVSYLDAHWRAETKPRTHQSAAFSLPRSPTNLFLAHHKNKLEDLGNWNHNFACFDKDPLCGRDFDWVKKKE